MEHGVLFLEHEVSNIYDHYAVGLFSLSVEGHLPKEQSRFLYFLSWCQGFCQSGEYAGRH